MLLDLEPNALDAVTDTDCTDCTSECSDAASPRASSDVDAEFNGLFPRLLPLADDDEDQNGDLEEEEPHPLRGIRRRTRSCTRIAMRWNITTQDARELCDAFEAAQAKSLRHAH